MFLLEIFSLALQLRAFRKFSSDSFGMCLESFDEIPHDYIFEQSLLM